MSDQERLAGYVEVWWQAVEDFVALLEQVPDEQWATPTDLPGWDVRACAAHTAHLESVLAGRPEETADVGEPAHVRSPMGLYTEIGVVTRREREPASIVAEIREVTALRREQLRADPPTDASARPRVTVAGAPWTWEVMLRNRPLDVWMHEQDVRRAVGRPGGLDTAAARHTIGYLMGSFGYVVAKAAKAPPGTTATLEVEGHGRRSVVVGPDGRGTLLDRPEPEPDVTLSMDAASFVVLAGGRCEPAAGGVAVSGDQELGGRILTAMATTP